MKTLGVLFYISSIFYIFGFLLTGHLGILMYLIPTICAGVILTILIGERPGKFWFKAKSYGWGWMPATWQGWMITVVFGIFIGLVVFLSDVNSHSASDILMSAFPFIALLLATLLAVCMKTGEKPSWRWKKG